MKFNRRIAVFFFVGLKKRSIFAPLKFKYMKTVFYLFCLLCLTCLLYDCSRIEKHSEIPKIQYKSLSIEEITTELGREKRAILLFSFVDGDGDIGVRNRNDSISKIHYTWYKKLIDENYEIYVYPSGKSSSDSTAIPYDEKIMNKESANNKTLKGTIEIVLESPLKPVEADSIMHIKFHIFDRAGHKSNIEQTPDFNFLTTNGAIKAQKNNVNN